VFVNVINASEAGGTELSDSDSIGADIERSLGGTSRGWDTVDRGSSLYLLLVLVLVLCSNVQSGLLLQRNLGLELLLLCL
jgi:hypothetical protein